MKPPREADWSRVSSSEVEWRAFCSRVGLRFLARAARRVTHDGRSIAEAVNDTIASEADDMLARGAPASLVARFVADYTDARAHQMALVGDWVENWRRIEEIPVTKTRLRKRPRAAARMKR